MPRVRVFPYSVITIPREYFREAYIRGRVENTLFSTSIFLAWSRLQLLRIFLYPLMLLSLSFAYRRGKARRRSYNAKYNR